MKRDFDISVSSRLPVELVEAIDAAARNNFSDRSKLLRALIIAAWAHVSHRAYRGASLPQILTALAAGPGDEKRNG